jgi:hypothetical protein
MKVVLIMTTVIFITNGIIESKFESIWSADMVKIITRGVIKRYFANCIYLLYSSYDQGKDLALILHAKVNLLNGLEYGMLCVGNLTEENFSVNMFEFPISV